MEREIDQAMSMLFREGDKIGEQSQTVAQPATPD
jgi:hypothetical protein